MKEVVKRTAVTLAALCLLGTAVLVAAAPASAAGTGQSYGCQINPNAANCQNTVSATTQGGSVSGVSSTASQPSALPSTGGAAGKSPAFNWILLALAVFVTVLGLRVRQSAPQRR